ncbi:MAG: 2-oxoacid:acceptor oxidoreductase family protein, partial [Clostridia bacterium]|nr:2-oxoacid:acceptor oxidoreductase family protein [Clostridia bacterium]
MTTQILIAGFGGQGVLFAGKCLAYEGMFENKQVSWLPSYGPEMRGGTANCSVILSDEPVGSPIVSTPDVLIVMNSPSLDKYEDATAVGGKIFVDSALISREVRRSDVDAYYIPATKLASDLGIPTLANMIIVGKMIKETALVTLESA